MTESTERIAPSDVPGRTAQAELSGEEVIEGGCHCGRVRFRVKVSRHEALECNCSICEKKGFLHLIVESSSFDVLSGADVLTTYSFGTHVARHTFCSICGIHPFYTPRSHPDGVDVNVRCLDADALSRFTVVPFDGRKWEASVAALRGSGKEQVEVTRATSQGPAGSSDPSP